jgi:DNA-binding IclR family transcriptional regulator
LDKKEKKTKSEYTGHVPAVDQASRILLSLTKSPSAKVNLTDICKSVGIHKSKGYSILNTLQKERHTLWDLDCSLYPEGSLIT